MDIALLTIVGVLLLAVPGFLVAWVLRLKWYLAAVIGPAVTFGMVTIGTAVTSAAGIPWNAWTALATLAIFLVLGWAYTALLGRVRRRGSAKRRGGASGTDVGRKNPAPAAAESASATRASPQTQGAEPAAAEPAGAKPADEEPAGASRPPWYALTAAAAGVLVGMGTIYTILLIGLNRAPGGLQSISNVWDQQWHANVIRFIADTGIGGANDMGRLMNVETHAHFYYPDTWHALAALQIPLTGAAANEVLNMWVITCLAVVVPLSVACLAWRFTRDRFRPTAAALASGCAGALSGIVPTLPYVEVLTTANPNAVGVALAGIVTVLIMSVTGAPCRIPLAVLALIGLAGVHPSGAVFSALILAVWWLCEALWRPRRGRLRDLAALGATAIITLVVMAPQITSVFGETGTITEYDFTSTASRWAALRDGFSMASWVTISYYPTLWLVSAAAVVGCVVLLARRSAWATILWALMLLAICDAAVPFGGSTSDILHKFTDAFYADPRRIVYAIAILVVALAGTGIALLIWGVQCALARWAPRWRRTRSGVAVVLALAVPIAGSSYVSTYATALGDMALSQRSGRVISDYDVAAMRHLTTLPDAFTTTVFLDPDQGMGWMYALEGLHPLFTHYQFPDGIGDRTWTLWDALNTAGENPRVDDALRELNVKYIMMAPPQYWAFQQVPPGLQHLDETPGLQLVYRRGDASIYRVRAWRPPAPGERTYGWDPTADRSDVPVREDIVIAPPPGQ